MSIANVHNTKRDLLFPPYGLLACPTQITNMPFRLYNLETPICIPDYVFQTLAKYKRNVTPHFYSFTVSLSPLSLSLSLSLSLHYPKFRTPQILSKFGVFLLKRTAFQPYSNIMEGKFDFCTHAWLIWLIFFWNSGRVQSGFRFPN